MSEVPQVPKTNDPREIERWYLKLSDMFRLASKIAWATIDKTSSSLADLATRPHANLTNILGYTATSTDTTADKHVADNDGKNWEDHRANTTIHTPITDGAADKVLGMKNPASGGKEWKSVTGTTPIVVTHTAGDIALTHDATGVTEAHGATGANVGTTNTQELSNKTLSRPFIDDIGGTASNDAQLYNSSAILRVRNRADSAEIAIETGGYYDTSATATRVIYVSAGKAFIGSANLTFDGTTLSVAGLLNSALSASQAVMTDGSKNLISADYLNQAVKTTSSPTFVTPAVTSMLIGTTLKIKDSSNILDVKNAGDTGFQYVRAGAFYSTFLTAKSFLYLDGGKQVQTTVAPTNGQLLIGSTGNVPVAAALTGTANQVVVTNAAGSITLSTPQNIDTGASPTFLRLTQSTPSAFRAYKASAQSIASGSLVKAQFDTEDYDNRSEFASNTFTSTDAGYYMFSAAVPITGATTATYASMLFYQNGANIVSVGYAVPDINGNLRLYGTTMLKLAAATTIDVYVIHDDVAALNTGAGTTAMWFTAVRIC